MKLKLKKNWKYLLAIGMAKKLILLVIIWLTGCAGAKAQKVYSTDNKWDADVKICVVDKEYKADLIVYRTKYRYEADDNEGIWYFTDYKYQADKTIFFVKSEYEADLKVCFTDRKYKAGWKSNAKKALMY